jgi:enoyl-CoA hydratase/carnithine racemase
MTTHEDLRYDVSDQIAEISLARPPVNALSLALLEQLIAALRRTRSSKSAHRASRRWSAGHANSLGNNRPAEAGRKLMEMGCKPRPGCRT